MKEKRINLLLVVSPIFHTKISKKDGSCQIIFASGDAKVG